MRLASFLLVFLVFSACQRSSNDDSAAKPQPVVMEETSKLSEYWYQGEAEINRYRLEQNRYRDLHPGEAVVVFVSEDFLTDKQVKNDNYENPNSTSVLKANIFRRFTTGIYDYSIMNSVFTPSQVADYPATMKVTLSAQDWCGQGFMQLNQRGKNYAVKQYSYFENEGDQQSEVQVQLLEDEIMSRIRINPDALPTGKFEMLPGTAFVRLMHKPFEATEVNASREVYTGDAFESEQQLKVYKIEMPAFSRTMEFVYQAEAPYIIEGWTDTYPSAFDKKLRTSKATRTETMKSPYWEKNALEDTVLRNELGVEGF